MMLTAICLFLVAGSWHGTEEFGTPVPGPNGSARIEDCVNIVEDGVPSLPVRTVFIPVPPGSSPELSAVATRMETLASEPMPRAVTALPTAVLRGTVPLAGGFFAVVDIYPYSGGDRYSARVDLDLVWDDPRGAPPALPVPAGSLVSGVSPGSSHYWPLPRSRAESPFHGRPWARISVGQTGPVAVTGAMLEAAGCGSGHSVEGLGLFSGPGTVFGTSPGDEHTLAETAVLVDDRNGNGILDPDDRVLFYAFSLNRWITQDGDFLRLVHRYASHRVYWLTWGGAPGVRMEEREASPAGPPWDNGNPHVLTLEEDVLWQPAQSDDTGWVQAMLEGGGSVTVPYSLPGYSQDTGALFTVRMALDKATQCTVNLYVNGILKGSRQVNGTGPATVVFTGLFIPASGSARLEFVVSTGTAFLDGLDIEYDRAPQADGDPVFFQGSGGNTPFSITFSGAEQGVLAFDLTEPDSPVLLTGVEPESGFLTVGVDVSPGTVVCAANPDAFSPPDSIVAASPGRLVGTVTSGDKLIVVPASLLEGAWAVAAIEEQLGSSVVVATTREVYDEFGQGVTDPGAIRSAVRWAMDSWDQGCGELLLVGDGHYDIFNRTSSQPVMIPPWIRLNGTQEPPCVDDWFVMAHDNAVLPEIPVARLPVDSPLRLQTMVENALTLQSGATAGSWMNRCVLLADDEWGNGNSAREDFHTEDFESLIATTLPRSLRRVKFYLVDYPWPPGTSPDGVHPEKPEAREDFLELWNRGMGCLVFMGHGSANQITHEKVFRIQDVPALQNDGRLPVVILASCDLSAFDTPGVESIGEALVYSAGGGALSTVAATRKTFPGPTANYGFTRVLLDSLYNSGTPSGMAVWYSKLANSSSYGNNRYYVLFGIPGLPVPRPGGLPLIQVERDTLFTGELNTVSGNAGLSSGLVLLEIQESGLPRVYNMLGGGEIQYVQDGGTAWRGSATLSDGVFSADCRIPAQARTGSTARAEANALALAEVRADAEDPAVMVTGEPPAGDDQGPAIEMWIQGHRGVENPVVTGSAVFQADLADSSGICFLGGEGTRLRLFIDGSENDMGPYFSYNTGSTTRGRVSFDLPLLVQGQHLLILQATDGVGNPSSDSLLVTVAQPGETVFSQVAVYPNPGAGHRCFSFVLSGDAWVSVGIFTVTGREIARVSGQCRVGYNQLMWDGLDNDGDPPATGAYIYQLGADASAGGGFIRRAVHNGVFAVVNQGGSP
jgi:hypothetical protein